MATYTDNYQLTLPTYAEVADIATINNNMTKIDEIMHDSQISIATAYDASTTSENPYNTGDIVMYEKIAYKCKYDGVYGTWDATKWEQTTLADNLGGGDASEISYDNTTSGLTADDVQEAIDEVVGNIEDVSDGLDDAVESLAPAYDSAQTYDEGDIVSKDNKIYQCNTDNTTGDWDSTKWDEYVISEHMGEGGSTVTITPETIAEPKQKIADFGIDGVTESLYAPIVEIDGHASGAIASFPDGANNKPLKRLKVAINPVQSGSGDPSPSNVRPITGWTGAEIYHRGGNLWDEETVVGKITNNGVYTSSGDRVCSKNFISVKGGETYFRNSNVAWLFFYESDNEASFISTISTVNAYFTTPSNARFMKFYTAQAYGTSYNHDISINYPSTDTDYHAYVGTTHTISWSEAGEVFGGYIDLERKKVVATAKATKFKDLGVTYSGTYFNISKASNNIKSGTSSDLMCEVYPYTGTTSTDEAVYQTSGSVRVLDSNYTSLESFINDLGDYKLWYPLATPIEYDLDEPVPTITTLLGNNNIWSDTGEIEECVYQRDLNLVINQFDARITALEQALSGTRSLSLSKSVVKEEETKEEPKEEEETKEEER